MFDEEQGTKSGKEGSIAYFWQQAHSYGAKFFVDGELMSPNNVRRAVKEEDAYMADYILNEMGEIAQVRLDKVKVQ